MTAKYEIIRTTLNGYLIFTLSLNCARCLSVSTHIHPPPSFKDARNFFGGGDESMCLFSELAYRTALGTLSLLMK